jgi:DNA repair photolyase
VKDYFNKNKITIFKNIINNFDDVIEKKFITIYLSNVSDNLQNLLKNN